MLNDKSCIEYTDKQSLFKLITANAFVWLTCDKLTDLYDGDAEMEELLMRCWELAAMIKNLKSVAAID